MQATVESYKLEDNSEVFDVIVQTGSQSSIKFSCDSAEGAAKLARVIEEHVVGAY